VQLELRRWRAPGPRNAKYDRLILRHDSERIGLLDLQTNHLYLDDEELRPEVVAALVDNGHVPTGAVADELRCMPRPPHGWTVYPGPPGSDRTKLRRIGNAPVGAVGWSAAAPELRVDLVSGEYLRPELIGVFVRGSRELSISWIEEWDDAVRLLRWSGQLGQDEAARPTTGHGVDVWVPGLRPPASTNVSSLQRPAPPNDADLEAVPIPNAAAEMPRDLQRVLRRVLLRRRDRGAERRPRPAIEVGRSVPGAPSPPSRGRIGDPAWPADFKERVDTLMRGLGRHFATAFALQSATAGDAIWQAVTSTFAIEERLPTSTAFDLQIRLLAVKVWNAALRQGECIELPPRRCRVCQEDVEPAMLPARPVALLHSVDYCASCASAAAYGTYECPPEAWGSAISWLASVQGWAPPLSWPQTLIPETLDKRTRDQQVLARMVMPYQYWVDQTTWNRRLADAGLVRPHTRASRGVPATATDGHPCRSLFECAIDNYMSAAGIRHEIEPPYPYHRALHPSGGWRADWQLEDGTLVEAAGMMQDDVYAAKMAAKSRLCEAMGLRLVIIVPNDLPRLRELFGALGFSAEHT
jgi:hypothetical protein